MVAIPVNEYQKEAEKCQAEKNPLVLLGNSRRKISAEYSWKNCTCRILREKRVQWWVSLKVLCPVCTLLWYKGSVWCETQLSVHCLWLLTIMTTCTSQTIVGLYPDKTIINWAHFNTIVCLRPNMNTILLQSTFIPLVYCKPLFIRSVVGTLVLAYRWAEPSDTHLILS